MTKAEKMKIAVNDMKKKLRNSKRWRYRALLVIYWLQTELERRIEKTVDKNYVGFTKADGDTLAPVAKRVIRELNKRSPNAAPDARIRFLLSSAEDAMLYHKITKYAKQLLMIADGGLTPPTEASNPRYKL